METEFLEPVTPAFDKAQLWSTEDSGYHTSFTPGSVEVSSENFDPKTFSVQASLSDDQDVGLQYTGSPKKRYSRIRNGRVATFIDSTPKSPRKGRKRRHNEDEDVSDQSFDSVLSPTSYIAGSIQRLNVDEGHVFKRSYAFYTRLKFNRVSPYQDSTPKSPLSRGRKRFYSEDDTLDESLDSLATPTSYIARGIKKLHVDEGSKISNYSTVKAVRSAFKPDQKVDIIRMLKEKNISPALNKIFNYLERKDIYNFTLVSPVWLQTCANFPKANHKRREYMTFISNTKENCGSIDKDKGCAIGDLVHVIKDKSANSLRAINNLPPRQLQLSPKRSPPGSPRTIKFKRFTKVSVVKTVLYISFISK